LRTDLIKVKKVYVGADSDEDIYFEDSEIHMYDYGVGYRGVALKYSNLDFLKTYCYSGAMTDLNLQSTNHYLNFRVDDDGESAIFTDLAMGFQSVGHMFFRASPLCFDLYSTGQIQLPNLSSDPTANLTTGQLAIVNNVLRIYNGTSWSNV